MLKIREAEKDDLLSWAEMRNQLWPESVEQHIRDLEEYFSAASIDIIKAFVLDTGKDEIAGFIELNIRNFAEGSRSPKTPYVEAWYIDEKYRGMGYGKKLMNRAEKWAIEKGFRELASDTTIENTSSISIHKTLGFKETERVVCFLKRLT